MTNVIRNRVAMSARLLLTLSLGLAPTALAALGELDIPSYPYTPLGSIGTPITGVTGVWQGLGTVKLKGWSFPFAKTNWTELMVSADGFLTVGNGQQVCQCNASSGNTEDCPYGQYGDGCEYDEPPLGGLNTGYNPTTGETYTFAPQFSPGLIAPSYIGNGYDQYCATPPCPNVPPFLGTISTLQGGPTGSHYLIVDYNGVGISEEIEQYCEDQQNCCSQCPTSDCYCEYPLATASFPRQFQAIMFESGAIVFTYGTYPTLSVAIPDYGIEEDYSSNIFGVYFPPPDGGMGITDAGTMLGPSQLYAAGACMNTWITEEGFCNMYEGVWPELTTAYMGDLGSAFLASVPSPVGSATAKGPQIDISVTITNNGKTKQAKGFPVDFFLIPQGVPPFSLPSTCPETGLYPCLAAAFPAAQSMTFNSDIPPGGSATQALPGIPLPTPLPASGEYAVASVIDPLNTTVLATAPLLEIGVSKQLLALGQDMTATIEVTNFTAIQPGEFAVPINFLNLGLEEAISVPYTVSFIAADDTPIVVVPTASVSGIAGLGSELVNQDITVPAGLAPGVYQIEVKIQPGIPTDLNLNNNTILDIQRVVNGQDMTASIISAPFAIATPTTFTVPVAFDNLGLQPATDIPWTMSLTSADGTASYQIGGGIISLAGLGSSSEALAAKISQTLSSGSYTLSLTLGNTSQGGSGPPTPDLNTANNIVMATAPVYVYSGTADYAVGPGDLMLDGSAYAADGQVISVTRTIHNLEGAAPPCPYSYYLNPPTVTEIGNGVPVAILTPTGPSYLGATPPFGPYGQEGANNTISERILIPVGLPVGTYNLVLALDPENQVNDINPANNDTYVSLNLSANPLQITCPSSLLAAIVQTPYYYKLEASGQGSDASWSLVGGMLPPGIAVDNAGELTGTPTTPGVYTFVVQLASEGGTQAAVLNLPVAAGSGALSIEQGGAQLPSAIVGASYLQQLVAQGGVPPYTWKGTIPQAFGMYLTAGGVLAGVPSEATDGPVQFTVVVTDAIGTQASATLALQVIAPGGLTITTPFLQPAVVGTQYDQSILASDGAVAGASFNWSLPPGTSLPAGITFQELGNPAVADLSGEATQAGIFPIVVNLSDNFGHSAQRQYILTVTEAAVPVQKTQKLPLAVIGQPYAAQLQATSVSTLSWRIFSGALPPGLSLAPMGSISGIVPSGTVTGTYPFAAAVTASTGAESVVPLEIQVELAPVELQVELAPVASGGCASGGGPAGAGLLLLAFAWLTRRREMRRFPSDTK